MGRPCCEAAGGLGNKGGWLISQQRGPGQAGWVQPHSQLVLCAPGACSQPASVTWAHSARLWVAEAAPALCTCGFLSYLPAFLIMH